LLLLLKVKLT